MAELERPGTVHNYLLAAMDSLGKAHRAASEREGDRVGLNGPVRDMIFALNSAVDTLAQMVDPYA